MKFIHMADMHFDAPFTNLSDKENFGNIRRMEQRAVFKKIIILNIYLYLVIYMNINI